jgi:hypothetical protein
MANDLVEKDQVDVKNILGHMKDYQRNPVAVIRESIELSKKDVRMSSSSLKSIAKKVGKQANTIIKIQALGEVNNNNAHTSDSTKEIKYESSGGRPKSAGVAKLDLSSGGDKRDLDSAPVTDLGTLDSKLKSTLAAKGSVDPTVTLIIMKMNILAKLSFMGRCIFRSGLCCMAIGIVIMISGITNIQFKSSAGFALTFLG